MMSRFPAAWTRMGTGAAVLALAALTGAATPAFADENQPDLFVSFDRDPVAEVDNSGTTIGMYVYNYGEAPATAVTVTLDVSGVSDAVKFSVPEWSEGCKLSGTTVTCAVGQLDAGQVITVNPVDIVSRQGARPGNAGDVTVTISGAEDDANPGDNTTTFPVTVIASGPDLIAEADDLNTKSNPVGPGDTAPVRAAIFNEGDSAATDFAFTLSLPTGAVIKERYSDCTYPDYWPEAETGTGYAYSPSEVSCVVPLTLEPGEALPLYDPETGESLFTASFGRNLPGPEEEYGAFFVATAVSLKAAKGVESAKGTSPAFASKLKKIKAAAKKSISAREIDELDNYADFSVWTKKNTLDVAVKVPAIKGAVGDTVDLPYEVINNGPSDGGGPSVDITAPTGTVLLPAEWCYTAGTEYEQKAESRKLHCNFESLFPTTHSGYGRITPTLKLKIKSTPGNDGTIVAKSVGISSTESNPDNNTAKIVVTASGSGASAGADAGADTGGEGGGLPVTGPSTGIIAGTGVAVLAIGVAVFAMFRRRRVVTVIPRD